MLERGPAIQADAGDAGDREFDGQNVALLAGWIVAGRAMDGIHGTVGESLGIEAGRRLGVLVVPQADRVLGNGHGFVLFPLKSGSNYSIGRSAGPLADTGSIIYPHQIEAFRRGHGTAG